MDFSNYEIINIDQLPSTLKWTLVPLYKIGKGGETRYWQIGYDPITNKLISISKVIQKKDGTPGKARKTELSVKLNKSGRNYQEQALLQAKSKYRRQYDREGYRPAGEEPPKRFKEMLANNYIPPGKRDPSTNQPLKTNIRDEQLIRGVSCQAKVDGIRALAWINDEKNYVNLYSRGNKQFETPIHIRTELWYFFFYLKILVKNTFFPHISITQENEIPEIGIDGELYNHDMTFEEITSIVRTENEVNERINKIQYWIFDIMIKNIPTEYRLNILQKAYEEFKETEYYQGNILILTSTSVYSHADIKVLFDHYISLKYEGLMIRKLAGIEIDPTIINRLNSSELKDTYYESGRSNNLLKYKEFITEEVTVLDIVSGEGKEEGIGNLLVQDIRGNVFIVHPKGSFEKRRDWLLHKQNYIGKLYTIKYNELTENGVPRFPVGLVFRTYE